MMALEKVEPVVEPKLVNGSKSSSNTTVDEVEALKENNILAIFDKWYYSWEIFGIIGSAIAIIIIAMLAVYFDDKPAPVWSYGLSLSEDSKEIPVRFTLNSLLAIISVFGSTCALIPVTKGLGQLKYLWFIEKDRTLADLETFDSASRGITGSLKLLWRLRFKYARIFPCTERCTL
jgi:hypothetical protein